MKLVDHFRSFLESTVNIDDKRLATLNNRIELIDAFLKSAPVIGDQYVDTIAQGSLAHRTIIKPLPGHEFDADILLELVERPDWQPNRYVNELYAAFRTNGNYKDRVSRKNRCVRVQYAGDCHVDVVPYLERGGQYYITARNEGTEGIFERTDPVGYTAWLDTQNRIANGNLIKAIRLVKWLRDYKTTFTCRSLILNVLLGERISSSRVVGDATYYSDLPTTLVHLLEDLSAYLVPYGTYMPRIADPACPEIDFNHRWDNNEYLNFRDRISSYATKARAAYDAAGRNESIRLWRELFGADFAAAVDLSKAASLLPLAPTRKGDPGEEFIDLPPHNYPIVETSYEVRVAGRTEPKNGFRTFNLGGRGGRIGRNRYIRFRIEECTVPSPDKVLWKIKNRGDEARVAECLRGEIVPGNYGDDRREPTKYAGNHYVECYIIKGGKCVAIDRQPVVIV